MRHCNEELHSLPYFLTSPTTFVMEQTPQLATTHKVPDVKLLSVEFPGHVKNINKVKEALGGEQAIRNVSLSSRTTSFTKRLLRCTACHYASGTR